MNIHSTAIVSDKAKLSDDVEIGPYVLIEEDVQIGQRVKVFSQAHILKHTTVGDDCQIHIGAILGELPQVRQNINTGGKLTIGKKNIFREYSTVHRSNKKDGATSIGDNNYFMAFSHVAHDCSIGSHTTICNGTLIAGYATVEDFAFISGNVTVHQFCRIGRFAMVAGLARVGKDVPPYMLVKGDSTIWALNTVGLKRANFSLSCRSQIKEAFKLLYRSGLNVRQALEKLQTEIKPVSEEIKYLIDFILHSRRGICSYKSPSLWQRLCLSYPVIRSRRIPAYQLFQSQSNRRRREILDV